MERPVLSSTLSETEFAAWYWLKAELVQFCRTQELPVGGSKRDIAARISAHLSGSALPIQPAPPKKSGVMPETFQLESVIGPGWRCTQELRVFFVSHVGEKFRFNEALRTFIATKAGKTLQDALTHYERSLVVGGRPIASQFEYNRHMRAFYAENPGATHAEAVASWWKKRGKSGPQA